ncbi:MAG: tRNA (N(6)-L-threonylcarbamoyladenosine(37)-C(2))-methylthiotransferase MtaB [Clostridiales bacterium]|jgi:threonylcarbamoyladenosine tRNA methylthiotransferase MtaB|nr:tRNA (N(6)-L-threonylcarbamoyladenosine(37)-C(2))-methylthiotransferase MtaB [Clostridiales bacterium]
MAKRVAATTIGCKVNVYDTQVLMAEFERQGHIIADFRDEADIYIINTCCVTNLADKKSRQMVGRARQRSPQAIVVAMGCAGQANPLKYRDLGVDIVVGTTNRGEILKHIANFKGEPIVAISEKILSEKSYEDAATTAAFGRTRAYLKIQEGCNNFCTYCIIPHVRGPSRSRDFEDSLAQAEAFAAAGYKEIVVAGIHVASYGKDLKEWDLVDLLAEIAKIPEIARLRLSSIEPMAINDKFCDFMAQTPKFCEHLHLSLQSGSDSVLKNMRRKYDTKLYEQAVGQIRKISPQANITTDLIAGFPGETEDDHRQTLEFVRSLKLTKLHVFPFAAKAGTIAAELQNQLPKAVKTRRVKELLALSAELEKEYYAKFLWQIMPVLVEKKTANGRYSGKTTNYIPVEFETEGDDLLNEIVGIKMSNLLESKLIIVGKLTQ